MSGKILIPQIDVVPTAVVANPNTPPELEIRFDMIPSRLDRQSFLPLNWQLRFIHNQLFKYFEFPSRFCPGAFHSTIVRKAEFRSAMVRENQLKLRKWIRFPKVRGWSVLGFSVQCNSFLLTWHSLSCLHVATAS